MLVAKFTAPAIYFTFLLISRYGFSSASTEFSEFNLALHEIALGKRYLHTCLAMSSGKDLQRIGINLCCVASGWHYHGADSSCLPASQNTQYSYKKISQFVHFHSLCNFINYPNQAFLHCRLQWYQMHK